MLEYLRNLTSAAHRRSEDGASAVEYGLLVAGIAALVVAVVFVIGGFIKTGFGTTCTKIADGDQNTTTTAANCNV